jgi:hypothetical protein
MAESFVVTVIAFPLFLVIIISIMGMMDSGGGVSFEFLWIIALLIVPMAYAGFYVMMSSGMGETI